MSALERTREHANEALVNGHPVGVHQAHRVPGERDNPALVTVAAPVALTLAETAAVLFECSYELGDWSLADVREALTDGDYVRLLIATAVVNRGFRDVEDALFTALDVAQGDPEAAALLAYCSQRARAVFGQGPR